MGPVSAVRGIVPSRQLIGIFASLTGSQVGSALIGLVFWMVAAHTLAPDQLGVGAALVAAMSVLSMVGVLGVGTLLLERLPVVPASDRRALYSAGLAIAGLGGMVFAGGFLVLCTVVRLPGTLGNLSATSALLLVVTSGLAALCAAFDQAAIGLGASNTQLRRNLLAAVVRVIVLVAAVALGSSSGQMIPLAWAIGFLVSVCATPLRRHLPPRGTGIQHRWRLIRSHWVAAMGHHSLTLAMSSSSYLLPVVVAATMPPAQVAYFAQARVVADTANGLQYYLTTALFATAGDPRGFRRMAARTLAMGMILAAAVFVGAAIFGHLVLSAFGATYGRESLPLLLLLLSAGPALVVKEHFAVLRRLEQRRRHGAVALGLWTVAELTGAIVGGQVGGTTAAVCVGSALASTACALIALPVLIRAIRLADCHGPRSGAA